MINVAFVTRVGGLEKVNLVYSRCPKGDSQSSLNKPRKGSLAGPGILNSQDTLDNQACSHCGDLTAFSCAGCADVICLDCGSELRGRNSVALSPTESTSLVTVLMCPACRQLREERTSWNIRRRRWTVVVILGLVIVSLFVLMPLNFIADQSFNKRQA